MIFINVINVNLVNLRSIIVASIQYCKNHPVYTKVVKSFLEVSYDLSNKSLHWRNVDDLKALDVELSIGLPLLAKDLHDSE